MRRSRIALALLLGAAVAAGCARARLSDERAHEPYRSLLSDYDAQGSVMHRVNGAPDAAPPLRLALHQVPRQAHGRGPLLVMQPGVMSDRRTWRMLAPALAADYDLLLIDPPGCGDSDKPAPGRLGPEAWTPTWLGQHTLRAISRWEAAQGDARRRLVLVGHSLGGASILMAMGDPDLPAELVDVAERVEKIVLVQSADIGIASSSRDFDRAARISDAAVAFSDSTGILRFYVDRSIWKSVDDPCRAAHCQEARRIHRVWRCDATRRSMQAMLRRFRKTDAHGVPDWGEVHRLEMRYANIEQPVLILWSPKDTVLPLETAPKLRDALPNARLEYVLGAKHSPHQEQPLACRKHIRAFLEGAGGGVVTVRPRPVHSD